MDVPRNAMDNFKVFFTFCGPPIIREIDLGFLTSTPSRISQWMYVNFFFLFFCVGSFHPIFKWPFLQASDLQEIVKLLRWLYICWCSVYFGFFWGYFSLYASKRHLTENCASGMVTEMDVTNKKQQP